MAKHIIIIISICICLFTSCTIYKQQNSVIEYDTIITNNLNNSLDSLYNSNDLILPDYRTWVKASYITNDSVIHNQYMLYINNDSLAINISIYELHETHHIIKYKKEIK